LIKGVQKVVDKGCSTQHYLWLG